MPLWPLVSDPGRVCNGHQARPIIMTHAGTASLGSNWSTTLHTTAAMTYLARNKADDGHSPAQAVLWASCVPLVTVEVFPRLPPNYIDSTPRTMFPCSLPQRVIVGTLEHLGFGARPGIMCRSLLRCPDLVYQSLRFATASGIALSDILLPQSMCGPASFSVVSSTDIL